jgi:hypothetical protein
VEEQMLFNPKVPYFAKFVSLWGCLISIRVLLRLMHILPQSKSMTDAVTAYPSFLQHFILISEPMICLAACISLLIFWRISAVLFTLYFILICGNTMYREFVAPSSQLLALQGHKYVVLVVIASSTINLALVAYAWWVTRDAGWFDSDPETTYQSQQNFGSS